MNLSEYKRWYVLSEDHWYVSKVKQFNSKSINSFAKAYISCASVIPGNAILTTG